MRDRNYRRQVREKFINKRLKAFRDNGISYDLCMDSKRKNKFNDIKPGRRSGLLSKGDYGFITNDTPKKTNTRKSKASRRHNGGYGKSKRYSRHDLREIEKCDLK